MDESPGGVNTGLERMLPAVVSFYATSAGCKRRIPHGVEQATTTTTGQEEQGFRISNKRTRTFVNLVPASSSSGDAELVTIVRAALSPHRTSTESTSSAAVAEDGGDSGVNTVMLGVIAKHEHFLQGMAVSADGEEQEEKERLCRSRRKRFGITVTGEYSSHGGGNSTISSSSTDSDDEEYQEVAELGELESTASNAAQSSRSAPPAARRRPAAREVGVLAPPHQDEIDAFFAKAEEDLAKKFADKYNYDIVKNTPLQGRYEWTPSRIMP